MAQMDLFTEKKRMDLENRLVVANGEGEGGRWSGSLGLNSWIGEQTCGCQGGEGGSGGTRNSGLRDATHCL